MILVRTIDGIEVYLDGESDQVGPTIRSLVASRPILTFKEPDTMNLTNPPALSTAPAGNLGEGSLLDSAPVDAVRIEKDGAMNLSWTSQSIIPSVLQIAVDADDAKTLVMEYENAQGDATSRFIIPTELEKKSSAAVPFGELYLTALDVAKDEPRTFRVDRIKRLAADPRNW